MVGESEIVMKLDIWYINLWRYFEMERLKEGIEMEVAIQYNDSYTENVFSFANNINTSEGGTHLTGFRSALTRARQNPQ